MNPNFRKGGRAKQGSGHVWVLADLGEGFSMVSRIFMCNKYPQHILIIDKSNSKVDQ